ncbi:C2 domain containing protein [Trichomonas vaginalis G3]|uniref:C2 domain containing protein n=1 Tax=Trichomonas vaginalis (strain ATCC PRA-98 / G3) TaxID=412133 RepID=A2E097_TRIV3|nr:C2 domain (calcium/lipid-binding domain, CaLB) family [Trichomonas vaginalis G3]EAY13897.1 C2 domain containing protein [Trichomonas vaginalis G3]KAI5520919.1 C2 domain (calcium/lipid-binding domain, CaLB) family [Trichomonas vaginalis G3]|eukprot:XP_001326120.1 C2 domain containing protein [Trichomonas vaginalis G3]
MRSLHIKIVGLKSHPCRRSPMPFVYAGVRPSEIGNFQFTSKSNALPPFWDKNFDFVFQDNQVSNLDFIVAESRLMMVHEELGRVSIPLKWLPYNYVVAEWIPVSTNRNFIDPIWMLVMFHYCDTNVAAFSQERVPFAATPPWPQTPVTDQDLEIVWKPIQAFIPPVAPSESGELRLRQQEMQQAMYGSFKFQNSDIPLVDH